MASAPAGTAETAMAAPVTATPVTSTPVTATPAVDAPGKKVKVVAPIGLFGPPATTRPLKVAVYFGAGAGVGNSQLLVMASRRIAGTQVWQFSPQDFATRDLSGFDLLIFAGGSGSGQAKALGGAGREAVKKYVENGGSYLGICAGAYLSCSNYPWSLGLLNAKTIQPWARGGGAVALQLTEAGQNLFGKVEKPFPVRYNNGPVIERDNKPTLPPYTVVANFVDELPKWDVPPGSMAGSPAMVSGVYGRGKVLAISPHFEGTKNLENFLPRVIAWLSEKSVAH